jgi:hypothetical protein
LPSYAFKILPTPISLNNLAPFYRKRKGRFKNTIHTTAGNGKNQVDLIKIHLALKTASCHSDKGT